MGMPWYLQSFAFVDWAPGAGLASLSTLTTRKGLRGGEQVQLAADLAFARDVITRPNAVEALVYQDGDFLGRRLLTQSRWNELQDEGAQLVLVAGDAPLLARTAGKGLPDDWAEQLCLAIDGVLIAISRTKIGEPPAGEGVALPAVPLLLAVAGAAVSVIGSVAAWRFFDSELQTRTKAVTAAAESYKARLTVLKETGKLPPPSPIELGAVEVVREAAKEREGDAWLLGGAVAGGIAVGTVALAAVRRALG